MSTAMNIVVICGGPSPESDISRKSGQAVRDALLARGHNAQLLEADASGLATLIGADQFDLAWLALHGRPGEDGTVQGFLEVIGLPYTGSGLLASATAIDKAATRRVLAANDLIAQPAWFVADLASVDSIELPPGWDYPVVVKPVDGGSSIATNRVDGEQQLRPAVYEALAVSEQAMIEPFLTGRELSVALMDERVLGDVEVRTPGNFYDFDQKYRLDTTVYTTNPDLDEAVRRNMHSQALAAIRDLGCEGAVRVDFFVTDDGPILTEVNTIPGMTESSLFPRIASQAGIPFADLVEQIAFAARTKC